MRARDGQYAPDGRSIQETVFRSQKGQPWDRAAPRLAVMAKAAAGAAEVAGAGFT